MGITGKVLSLFLFMLAGLLAKRFRLLSASGVHDVTQLVLYVALPANIITTMQSIIGNGDAALATDMLLTLAYSTAFTLLGLLIGFVCFRKRAAAIRPVLYQLTMFSNCGFMGFPVVLAALGERALLLCVMPVIGFHMYAWTLGVRLFSGRSSLLKGLLNPALVSLALGAALTALGLRLPDAISEPLAGLGDMTTPLSMIVIGARVTGFHLRDLKDGALLWGTALRLIVIPALAIALLWVLGLMGSEPARVTALTLGMPAAAMIVMQAEQYGKEGAGAYAARVVAVTTALSLVTIPLLVIVLNALPG